MQSAIGGALAGVGQSYAAAAHRRLAFTYHPDLRETILRWRSKFAYADAQASLEEWPCADRKITQETLLWIKQFTGITYLKVDVDLPGQAGTEDLDLMITSRAANGREPWDIDQLIPGRIPKGTVECTQCGTTLPVVDEYHPLCDLCGASLDGIYDPCKYCGNNSLGLLAAVLDGNGCPCPYCRTGRFAVQERFGET